jgi:hypothetical protein
MLSKRGIVLWSSTLALVLLALAGEARADAKVTTPGSVGSNEGNSDNLYPFNGDPIRYQQIIAASEFSNRAGWITQIVLRPDAASGASFSERLTNVQINLSTSAASPSSLSKTFAANIGSDETVAYAGSLALSSAFSGQAGGPMDFDIVITLQTPFYYDSNVGNVLLDVRNYLGGRTTQMDAQDSPDTTSRVWSLDVNSPTAVANDPYPSAGLVIRFVFQ